MRTLVRLLGTTLLALTISSMAQPLPAGTQASAGAPTTRQAGTAMAPPLALSPEEIYALRKLKMQEELQGELLSWAQTRFWVIAAIGLLVGFFGVRALVREMLASELKEATKASAEASASAALGKDVVKEVRAEANKYKDEVAAAVESLAQLQRQLNEIRSRVDSESIRIGAQIELKVDSLSKQIAELTDSISTLSPATASNGEPSSSTRNRIDSLRAAAKTEDQSFEERSKYRVVVVHHEAPSRTEPIAVELVQRLSRLGFKASIGMWASGKADRKKRVEIEVKPSASPMSDIIKSTVAEVLTELTGSAGLVVKEHDFRDEEYEVRIFF